MGKCRLLATDDDVMVVYKNGNILNIPSGDHPVRIVADKTVTYVDKFGRRQVCDSSVVADIIVRGTKLIVK